ncbi:hypothetical protein KSF_111910 [Reticulibacter mediterranei]|uniref:Protein kinase domain-containing protein n=1 Tax=Reticulibacter mediterranei TaxID=2778369 RepID=A0A8J3IZ28_9CHLR|nr:serine/threonine-protein kinase [Reticulibacter mediterranei]GHP01144.1 hypothetical protein KSF_111910 [Reticulibacter mediterranei]
MHPSPLSVNHLVGRTLGTYHVERLLGYGNSYVACLARKDVHLPSVTLNLFPLPETFSLQARERFRTRFTEVTSKLMQLRHPSLSPVYDAGEQWGYFYLVTPLVTTGSLARTLKQQGKLTIPKAQAILRQVADGLDSIHRQGMIHGTLANSTIFVESEDKIQMTEVGLGSILSVHNLEPLSQPYRHLASIAGTFLGAPEYIAPEVVQGAPRDARADVYALGALLFEWLTGLPPFLGADPLRTALLHVQQPVPSLLALRPDLPPALDLVLGRALEPHPEQRYQSAGHLANAFERVLVVIEESGRSVSSSIRPIAPPQQKEDMGEYDQFKKTFEPSSMAKSGSATPEKMMDAAQDEEETDDLFVRWSTASLAHVQTRPSGSLTNSSLMTQKHTAPVDKGRRRIMRFLAIGGGIAVGFLGVGGIDAARTMMQTRQSQQMPGMQMDGGTMPMDQMTPSQKKTTATPMSMP